MKAKVLFVEDDDIFRPVLTREIEGFGYTVIAFSSGEGALAKTDESSFDVALVDLRLPGMDGLELLRRLKERDADMPVIVLTGHGGFADAVEAMRAGAHDFLGKPAPLDELELTLERAIEHGGLRRKNHLLRRLVNREAGAEIVGESKPILDLRSAIAKVGPSDANVLVVGENGTGKELVARAIHDASPRRDAAFVVVNCGAIPSELVESELFGHVRGAFTGASQERLGLIALADGGTLFLDEVGELPMAVQPALLRAVQFGEFRPVGSERNAKADLRVVAATNRDLEEAVAEGGFREDLYHRLSTLLLSVPPLRERGDDVTLLAEVMLARQNARLPSEHAKRFSESALARLRAHEWTGNVRELENVVVRLVTLVDGAVVEARDVEAQLRPVRRDADAPLPTLELAVLEREAVVQALRQHAGNRSRASAELGVAVKTLYNKIHQHDIAAEEWGG